MTRIFIWGAGRCGTVLGRALHGAGHEIVGAWNRSRPAPRGAPEDRWPGFFGDRPSQVDDAEVVIISVTDGVIEGQAAIALREHHVGLHLAGAVPAAVLRVGPRTPRSVASCHPLQSFPDRRAPPGHVSGISFGVEGEPEACAVAQSLVTDMGAHSFVVRDATAKALYHAACCVASNALVALADRAVTLFEGAGVTRQEALRALSPLIMGTAQNLSGARRPIEALTGPIMRGDTAVIGAHRDAIETRLPDEGPTYEWVVREVERLVHDASD